MARFGGLNGKNAGRQRPVPVGANIVCMCFFRHAEYVGGLPQDLALHALNDAWLKLEVTKMLNVSLSELPRILAQQKGVLSASNGQRRRARVSTLA